MSENHPRNLVSRRTVLRGMGASLTLPWLESFAWHQNGNAAPPADARPPVRWGCILFANGVNPRQWWARGEGKNMRLSPTLQPLAPFRDDILVLRDLHVFNNTSGPHWPLFTNYLNGVPVRQSLIPQGGQSVDQLIARHVRRQTPLPSLVLGVEPAEHGLRGGVPAVYYATISWTSRNTPIPPEIYPRATFDRLFDKSRLLRDRSVLDTVLAQTRDVRRNLSGADQGKMDQFLESVRELEQRLERAGSERRLEGWQPSLSKPNMQRPPEKLPQDVRDHMRMMMDLMLLAWQMDRTRVVTLILNRDVSHMQFGFLEGVGNKQLHAMSHHQNNAGNLEEYQRVNRFHVEQFAYLLRRMKDIDEGNGSTLLDNVMLLFGSNMLDGNIHDGRNLPLVLAGRGGGRLRPGRVLDFSTRSEREQRLCNLHLAMAQRMGIRINRFGDSVQPLPSLS